MLDELAGLTKRVCNFEPLRLNVALRAKELAKVYAQSLALSFGACLVDALLNSGLHFDRTAVDKQSVLDLVDCIVAKIPLFAGPELDYALTLAPAPA